MRFSSLGQEDPLEEEMATYFNIFAWRIPETEEPGGLRSMALQLQDLATKPPASLACWTLSLSCLFQA